ncbi:MAG: hypothetical protein QXI33_01025 [Candidatus Pacearchaeota archaeon]
MKHTQKISSNYRNKNFDENIKSRSWAEYLTIGSLGLIGAGTVYKGLPMDSFDQKVAFGIAGIVGTSSIIYGLYDIYNMYKRNKE